jgi:hypothetical protein
MRSARPAGTRDFRREGGCVTTRRIEDCAAKSHRICRPLFGAMACKEMVPDVEELGTGFVDAIEVSRGLAEQSR